MREPRLIFSDTGPEILKGAVLVDIFVSVQVVLKIFLAVFSRERGYAGATNSLSQPEARGTRRYKRIYFWHADLNSRLNFAYRRTPLIDLPLR